MASGASDANGDWNGDGLDDHLSLSYDIIYIYMYVSGITISTDYHLRISSR